MDVFGTVVGAINLAAKLVGYLQAVKGAKEDRRRLLPEISALGALLQVLRGRLGNSPTNGAGGSFSSRLVMAGIERPLRECEEALQDTVTRLERLVLDTNAGKSFSFAEKMKDIRWPFRQGEIKAMLDRVERLKSLVSLAFQSSLMEFVEKAHNELAAVGLNVAGIESTVSAIEADQRAHMDKTESLHVDLQALGWTLRDSANSITRIESTVAMIDRNQQDQALQQVLKWLSPLEFNGKHNAAFEKHAPGTGEWFLGHPKFLAWQRGEYKILWCPGGPGVGKSVMASTVICHLQGRISEYTAVVYIYFDYTIKYTVTQLLEALLSQLMRQRSTRSGMESLQSHMAGNRRPTLNELIDILKAEAGTYTRVFVVIDALDETDIQIWALLLRSLCALSGISLLATSRDTGEIAFELQPDQRLDVMTDEGDIRKYVRERLSGSTGTLKRLLKANVPLYKEIVAGVTEKAGGMFLLARLHMNSLEKSARITDLRRALTELPEDLKMTYDETIGRINDKDKPVAYQLFSWLMHAAKPMTIQDLRYALVVEEGMTAIDPGDLYDEGYLMSICLGLVVLRDSETYRSDKTVGFVHYTTQEYLRDCASTRLPHSVHLAITCLRYISFDIFNADKPLAYDARQQLLNIPFSHYAILYWGKHAHTHFDNTTVQDLVMRLLYDDRRLAIIGSTCDLNPSATQLCAYFGLKDYLEYLLNNGFDINSKGSEFGHTALAEAAMHGREEIVRLLLARDGIDVNLKNHDGITPLSCATHRGQQGTVELLLARDDVDVNSRGSGGMTPIAHAARRGDNGIVKLLLAKEDVDANLCDNDGMTPIAHAARWGHDGIMELLLAREDVDANSHNNDGMTPITHAAQDGHNVIVKLLLAREDVDANSRDNDGMTPIIYAAQCGHDGIVKLLLAREDVDANLCDNNGMTPVAHAARGRGGMEDLKRFMARDVYGNPRDNYETIIAQMAHGGNPSIVELLLARDDVDINSQDTCGGTPLTSAICRGHEVIVQLLLARDDLDLSLKDNNGDTHLAIAAQWSHQSMMKLLLARGDVNVNSRNLEGATALTCAAGSLWNGDAEVVKLLLEQDGIDINPVDSGGATPLDRAERRRRESIVQLLRAAGGCTGEELQAEARAGR